MQDQDETGGSCRAETTEPTFGEAACMLQALIRQCSNLSTGDAMESGFRLTSGTSGSPGSGKREG